MQPQLAGNERGSIVKSIVQLLAENYVFPETAEKMANYIQTKLVQGDYDSFKDGPTFCRALTTDLRQISNDTHCEVFYNPDQAKAMAQRETAEDQHKEADKFFYADRYKGDWGFAKLERLRGNIGYIDVRAFVPGKEAGDIAGAAMNFLKNCNALIFDLRQNRGGAAATLLLLASFLFEDSTHINTFYYRDTEEYEQFWTFPYVPGEKIPKLPVYILTSRHTVSGAEEFAYDLKNLKRATIVGEKTLGAAHMIKWTAVNEEIVMAVPFGRPINPITNTDWEGTGVEPDIAVPFQDALKTAHIHALEHLIHIQEDNDAKAYFRTELDDAKERYELA
jgi:C-terminal processing protease CtpA/Prc